MESGWQRLCCLLNSEQDLGCGDGSGAKTLWCGVHSVVVVVVCSALRAGLVVMAKAETLWCAVHHPELDLW